MGSSSKRSHGVVDEKRNTGKMEYWNGGFQTGALPFGYIIPLFQPSMIPFPSTPILQYSIGIGYA
jgi:hypothetical protein